MTKVLFISTSALETSTSTKLGERLIARIPGAVVTRRDLGKNPPPSIDQEWVGANSTPADKRSAEQVAKLSVSSALIAELKDADVVVLSVAIYNFSIPSSLKAWIDLIARAGETFQYGANGPQGLLGNKKTYIVAASGGTPVGSPMDFYSGYLKSVLGFVGIDAVLVASTTTIFNAEAALAQAHADIDRLAL